jgi:hypothetical protein
MYIIKYSCTSATAFFEAVLYQWLGASALCSTYHSISFDVPSPCLKVRAWLNAGTRDADEIWVYLQESLDATFGAKNPKEAYAVVSAMLEKLGMHLLFFTC